MLNEPRAARFWENFPQNWFRRLSPTWPAGCVPLGLRGRDVKSSGAAQVPTPIRPARSY